MYFVSYFQRKLELVGLSKISDSIELIEKFLLNFCTVEYVCMKNCKVSLVERCSLEFFTMEKCVVNI